MSIIRIGWTRYIFRFIYFFHFFSRFETFILRLRYIHGNPGLFHRLMPRPVPLLPFVPMRNVSVRIRQSETPVDSAVFKGSGQGDRAVIAIGFCRVKMNKWMPWPQPATKVNAGCLLPLLCASPNVFLTHSTVWGLARGHLAHLRQESATLYLLVWELVMKAPPRSLASQLLVLASSIVPEWLWVQIQIQSGTQLSLNSGVPVQSPYTV